MRSMRKHNALFILATIYLKGSCGLLDIQGSSFKLYDPEIATTDRLANGESLGSNLSCVAIDSSKSKHICNIYCKMMSLEQID